MEIRILHLVEGAREAVGTTVIIDVVRAFTAEAYMAKNNAACIIPVGDVETAWQYKAEHPDAVLCGERGGAIIEGFDFGNSPSAVEHLDFTGKTVIHTTSAGTQGIANATGADEILGGCLYNAVATAKYIKAKNPEYVSLVCMGLAGERPTDEDTLCALYIKSLLEGNPLEDMEQRVANLKLTDGAKFFDPEQQSVFPQRDFEFSTMVGGCPFALHLIHDPETGMDCMERIDMALI